MTTSSDDATKPGRRGFAAMDPERRREIARRGGASVPSDKRELRPGSQLGGQRWPQRRLCLQRGRAQAESRVLTQRRLRAGQRQPTQRTAGS